MYAIGQFSRNDIMARLKTERDGLAANNANPHQAVDVAANKLDEVLISKLTGNTCEEMRANGVATATKKMRVATGVSVGALAAVGAGLAGFLVANSGALGAAGVVGGMVLTVVSQRIANTAAVQQAGVSALDRWDRAIAAQQPPAAQPQPAQPPAAQPAPVGA